MKEIFIALSLCFGALLLFLYIGNTEISFSPFKIKVNDPMYALGWILIIAGLSFMTAGSRIRGYLDGYGDGVRDVTSITISSKGVERGESFKNQDNGN
jgi:O-antigen/teichoic acid export membrane protein